jgi:hypothetical protein
MPCLFPSQPQKIHRAIVKKLSIDNYIDKYIVPFAPLVHEGLSIEIMRGCTRGCSFVLQVAHFVLCENGHRRGGNDLTSLLPNTGWKRLRWSLFQL